MIELIFIWLLYVIVVSQLLPILLEFVGYLLVFLLECLWIAFTTTLKAIWFGLTFPFRRRQPQYVYEDPQPEQGPEEEMDFAAMCEGQSPYLVACYLLRLDPDGFTEKEFKRNYRYAIMVNHPDRGGSDEAATAINIARDVIRQAHGWA